MQKQKPTINGKPIQCIEKYSKFSGGKDILIWNINDSVIQLSQQEAQQYEQYYNSTYTRNIFNDQKINSELVREDIPKNLSEEQKRFEKKILSGDDKQSLITQPSMMYPSLILQGNDYIDCEMCKIKEQDMQRFTNKIKELQTQNEFINEKLTAYRKQQTQSENREKQLQIEIQRLKSQLKNQSEKSQKSMQIKILSKKGSFINVEEQSSSSFKFNKSKRSFSIKTQNNVVLLNNPQKGKANRGQSLILVNQGEERKLTIQLPIEQIEQIRKSKTSQELKRSLQHSFGQTIELFTSNYSNSVIYLEDSGQFTEIMD